MRGQPATSGHALNREPEAGKVGWVKKVPPPNVCYKFEPTVINVARIKAWPPSENVHSNEGGDRGAP